MKIYDVAAWHGPVKGVGTSSTPEWCSLHAVCKFASEKFPYVVANELVASRLGLALAVPVVPGVPVRGRDDAVGYASISVSKGLTKPAPVDPAAIASALPDIATGLVVFDYWIINTDRTTTSAAFTDHELCIFDHSHALLGSTAGKSEGNFSYYLAEPRKLLNCFGEVLDTADHIDAWIGRVKSIPEWFVRELCEEACAAAGITPSHLGGALANFLLERRKHLTSVLHAPGILPGVGP